MNITQIKKVTTTDEYNAALLQLGRLYLYDWGVINQKETTPEWQKEEREINQITSGLKERDAYREQLVEMICDYEEKKPALNWEKSDALDYLELRLQQMMIPVKQLHVMGASAGNLNLILNRKKDISKQQIRKLYKYFAIPSDILVKELKLKNNP